ncbi:hypothetical protein PUN4_740009 [Paraburkholderia unamae]|nr:hypothetical protein PUN4_740009 [Paraburkholderia unamae]
MRRLLQFASHQEACVRSLTPHGNTASTIPLPDRFHVSGINLDSGNRASVTPYFAANSSNPLSPSFSSFGFALSCPTPVRHVEIGQGCCRQ